MPAAQSFVAEKTPCAFQGGRAMTPPQHIPEDRPVAALLAPDILALLDESPTAVAAETEELHAADDERDPAPGPQVTYHIVRVGDEHVRVRDRGNAVEQVEEPNHGQQDRREDDQTKAPAFRVVPARAAGWPHCC